MGEESWREIMEYFVFEKYYIAINCLNDGYNCYGALESKNASRVYFRGNFWWATSKYISSLNELSVNQDNRYNAEFWIGSSKLVWNAYVPYNSSVDLYNQKIPTFLYKSKKLELKDVIYLIICYSLHILNAIRKKIK